VRIGKRRDGMKKKITFVLGAGASLPFIKNGDTSLNMKYLTERIFNRDRWDAIYNEFRQNYPPKEHPELNFDITLDDILKIIEKLKTINERKIEVPPQICGHTGIKTPLIIEDFYGIGEINFEHILYLLDRVCNYLFDRKNSLDNSLFDIWEGDDEQRQKLLEKKGWHYVSFLCREVLVDAIIELWESCDKERATKINKQFFTSVLEQFDAVSVYSLNYDPLLYEATKQIKVGDKRFRTGFSDGEKFNYKGFYTSNSLIAFLHGHVGFVQEGEFDGMRFYDDYPNAQKKRISGVPRNQVDYFRSGIKGIHYNVHITSGYDKFDSFYDNPYAYYIQRFSKDVMESRYIVFVGGGLGDNHITLFVSNAWRLANGGAPDISDMSDRDKCWWDTDAKEPTKRKIIIVDSSREDYTEFLNHRPNLKKLFGLFKEGIPINFVPGNENVILKKNGYGNFGEWFLYLKGTEKFFSEIWDIKNLFD
jgi:hypothetical protein